jgi:hypothetical protein
MERDGLDWKTLVCSRNAEITPDRTTGLKALDGVAVTWGPSFFCKDSITALEVD